MYVGIILFLAVFDQEHHEHIESLIVGDGVLWVEWSMDNHLLQDKQRVQILSIIQEFHRFMINHLSGDLVLETSLVV